MKSVVKILLLIMLMLSNYAIGDAQASATSAQPLRFGVLAFRPKPDTLRQWQPLADYLATKLDRPVALTALNYDELNHAASLGELDIIFTNPGHWVLLNHRNQAKSPLATVIRIEGGQELQVFGGVIFTQSGSPLTTLADIVDKRVATVNTDSLGGYQMQAFELARQNIQPASVMPTKMPHDNVIKAVLEGQADVGFVRTGVIESMIKEGALSAGQLKILNPQNIAGFPFFLSTPLYPEWPLTVSPHLDAHTARALTVAVLSIQPNDPVAIATGIHGFDTPAAYSGVENVLRQLRIAPFDQKPDFTLEDLWKKYSVEIFIFLMMVCMTIGLLAYRMFVERNRLADSNRRFKSLFQLSPEPIWLLENNLFVDCNLAALNLMGYASKQDIIGKSPVEFSPSHQPDGTPSQVRAEEVLSAVHTTGQRLEWTHFNVAGDLITLDVRLESIPLGKRNNVLAVGHDITQSLKEMEQLRLASRVFSHAREGVLITDAAGVIVEVNDALLKINGYSRDELIGQTPRLFHSGKHPPDFYQQMWNDLQELGYWSGEIWNKRRNGEIYAGILSISSVESANGTITHFVGHFTDISQIKAQEDRLRFLAHYDSLTGFPNRALNADRLRQGMIQCDRQGVSLALAYLDLDGFKSVNDRYGHSVGDELLVAISKRMKMVLREGDTLARMGGDEFVTILANLEHSEDCEPVIERLLAAASEPIETSIGTLQVSASIGVTIYPQDPASEPDQLLRHADHAMYQAKLAGKNRYQMFDFNQDVEAQSRRNFIHELTLALRHHELVLYYQPKVNMKSGEVIGVEALIRWAHPVKGLVPPLAFLPAVENHPLALEIGRWVIATALKQLAGWRENGLSLTISVNIGVYQLLSPGFVADLKSLLLQYPDVPPSLLELEILESAAVEDFSHAAEILFACRELGVLLALDDFGTGYSSLAYLKQLPVEVIKIDQGFVRDMLEDPEDLAIVEAVIGLTSAFRLNVIAEGVETEAHGETLLSLGCDLAQGYGIARPMPAASVLPWISAWQCPQRWLAWSGQFPTRHHAEVVFAEVGHREWIRAITSYVQGECESPPPMSPLACRLGNWLHHEGKIYFGEREAFAELVALHDLVHTQGRALIALHTQGKREGCEEQLAELDRTKQNLMHQLRRLVSS